ncbi:MAG: hypothetical protein AB8G99_19650 [Planctomycetaceae bacterium]
MPEFVLRILIVEDDPTDAEFVVRALRRGLPMKFEVEHSVTVAGAIRHGGMKEPA